MNSKTMCDRSYWNVKRAMRRYEEFKEDQAERETKELEDDGKRRRKVPDNKGDH
jgi:hypothetical protein